MQLQSFTWGEGLCCRKLKQSNTHVFHTMKLAFFSLRAHIHQVALRIFNNILGCLKNIQQKNTQSITTTGCYIITLKKKTTRTKICSTTTKSTSTTATLRKQHHTLSDCQRKTMLNIQPAENSPTKNTEEGSKGGNLLSVSGMRPAQARRLQGREGEVEGEAAIQHSSINNRSASCVPLSLSLPLSTQLTQQTCALSKLSWNCLLCFVSIYPKV